MSEVTGAALLLKVRQKSSLGSEETRSDECFSKTAYNIPSFTFSFSMFCVCQTLFHGNLSNYPKTTVEKREPCSS